MININLLAGERQQLGKFLTWVLSYGRYIIIGTEIIVLLAFLSRFKLDRDLTDLHQAIAQKEAVVVAAYDLEQEVRFLQNHLALVKKLARERDLSPKVLTALEQLTPGDVTLREILWSKESLSLTAIALSNNGFTTFINNLSTYSYFGDISLDEVSTAKGGGIQFRISLILKDI